jgi:isopenicillin-N N-acyltransferase-like protein
LEVLLHIKHHDSSLESFILSHAGFLAECGVNNQPIGICCNSLVAPLNHSTNGLPVTFIIRSVLEQTSVEKALEFLNKIPHASGQNYMIGGYEQVVSMECSPNQVVRYLPFEGARTIFHTNHPLENDDKKRPDVKYRSGSTTFNRFRYVKNRLSDHTKKFSVDTFKYILSSHFGPVCVHHDYTPASVYTYSSVIYELTRPPTLHITIGPPCLTEYQRFDFT